MLPKKFIDWQMQQASTVVDTSHQRKSAKQFEEGFEQFGHYELSGEGPRGLHLAPSKASSGLLADIEEFSRIDEAQALS